ncbi:MAG: bifunctional 23S rRNA (guanine(2069)-N(7))-methyltransferase RlmK/23S rRNA (guanine(2445)-N(2))-methyltransferase RlmL [Magnetococcales bacterium]|nr:bifunctional 23S rRNA (guanine(2069)-N(7))-methyltransferase RlmK/23S rRNA (guanine(2445)-N(2))-methyltransferase RlmL [Magnetococcales bacterium]
MSQPPLALFAASPRGMEPLLAGELRALGGERIRPLTAGVSLAGDFATVCRICLHSRVASRLQLPLTRCEATSAEALYQGVREIPWEDHLRPDGSLAVDFSGTNPAVRHTRFGAMKVKDAVVDRLRDLYGVRPEVRFEEPDLLIYARLLDNRLEIGIDLSGGALHRRGYRVNSGSAPLKENLAAAILLLAGWPEMAGKGGRLIDPMCGSGTLLIEAALMAGGIAPGLTRRHFGFTRWLGADPAVWEAVRAEAEEQARAGRERIPAILGFDEDPAALRAAQENVARAGLADRILLTQRDLAHLARPPGPPGLLVVNPPYGERQGEMATLTPLYAALGERLRTRMTGWRAAVFTAHPELAEAIGIRPAETKSLFNGALPCRLLLLDPPPAEPDPLDAELPPPAPGDPAAPGAVMFANRLRKNQKHLSRWLRREGVSCYRLYDADMPEYAVAVDLYGPWVHLQEYQPPAAIDPARARERLGEVLAAIPAALGTDPERIHLKTRRRQGAGRQYTKLANEAQWHEVDEGGLRFLVNFTDTLDVGLFLDLAPLRRILRQEARGRRFLNLFGYTGAATVHAAAGGAIATLTVDMSRTYLDWAGRNLALNGFATPEHRLVRADCLQWLSEAERQTERFDLILLDPPTFSNSARMTRPFDLQRDHAALISRTARLLDPGGTLYFSNHLTRFRMDLDALPADLTVQEITRTTIGPDFARHAPIHNSWRITRREGPC